MSTFSSERMVDIRPMSNAERDALITRLYLEGVAVEEIATEVGVARATIYSALHRSDTPLRRAPVSDAFGRLKEARADAYDQESFKLLFELVWELRGENGRLEAQRDEARRLVSMLWSQLRTERERHGEAPPIDGFADWE